MTPTWMFSSKALPSARNSAFKVSSTDFNSRISSTEIIIGNITASLPNAEARNTALNCACKISRRSRAIRTARHPKNGFISFGKFKYGSSLSPPISMVRNTTKRPSIASTTSL